MILTLKEHLDALKEDELRTFQWHLTHVKLGWGPIPRSQLDNATRESTVDKMVQAYGEDGAVEMMVSILKLMKRNDQATRLSQAKQSSNVGLHLLGSLSSTVRETHRDADWTISVDLSHSTFSFSGPVVLDSSSLTSSDHHLCQNCGTKVERLCLSDINAPISSVHSRLLSSSSIQQKDPTAAPLRPQIVPNPGVPIQSIHARIPQVENWCGPPTVSPVTSNNFSLQSLPLRSGSPVQRSSLFKNWGWIPSRDTSQNCGSEGLYLSNINAPISSVHSRLLSSSSIQQQNPTAAPLRPQIVPNPGVPIQSIHASIPQVENWCGPPTVGPITLASLYLQSLPLR